MYEITSYIIPIYGGRITSQCLIKGTDGTLWILEQPTLYVSTSYLMYSSDDGQTWNQIYHGISIKNGQKMYLDENGALVIITAEITLYNCNFYIDRYTPSTLTWDSTLTVTLTNPYPRYELGNTWDACIDNMNIIHIVYSRPSIATGGFGLQQIRYFTINGSTVSSPTEITQYVQNTSDGYTTDIESGGRPNLVIINNAIYIIWNYSKFTFNYHSTTANHWTGKLVYAPLSTRIDNQAVEIKSQDVDGSFPAYTDSSYAGYIIAIPVSSGNKVYFSFYWREYNTYNTDNYFCEDWVANSSEYSIRNISPLTNYDIMTLDRENSGGYNLLFRKRISGTWTTLYSIADGTSPSYVSLVPRAYSINEPYFIYEYRFYKYAYVAPTGPQYDIVCGQVGQAFSTFTSSDTVLEPPVKKYGLLDG